MTPAPVVAFDLDDTLYSEREFLHSGWRAVARAAASYGMEPDEAWRLMSTAPDAFDALHAALPQMAVAEMLHVYRTHIPDITLYPGASDVLAQLHADGCPLAIITDGRGLSQRNKLMALGLDGVADYVSISEEIGADKTSPLPFRRLMDAFPGRQYIYVGDNPAKDFAWPNRLGWLTVMLREPHPGLNIHPQAVPAEAIYAPQRTVATLADLPDVIAI